MAEELKMWAIGGGGEVAPVEQASHTETESLLEDTLVKNPDMLIPGLELVGRQTPTDGGPLDLLGVDPDGRLVVFELKRGDLTRDAVTQIIDYASGLEAMSDDQLAAHITRHSGRDGIDKIENFEDWYAQRFEEQPPSSLRPVRMMLVGLGADARAARMVDFLAARGVDVSLLTFHGYEHEGKTLLARQVRAEPEATEAARGGRSRKKSPTEMNETEMNELAERQGVGDIFREAVERFRQQGYTPENYGEPQYIFRVAQPLELPECERKFQRPFVLKMLKGRNKKLRVTFRPAAIHLCEAKFQEAHRSIHFQRGKAWIGANTHTHSERWYRDLDREEWNTHKETLFDLAEAVSRAWDEAVSAAWDEAGRSAGPQAAQSADMTDMD